MIYNTILVQLNVDGQSAPRLKFAHDLARRFDANVVGFAAANVHLITAMPPGAVIDGEFMRLETEEIERRLVALNEEFDGEFRNVERTSWRSFVGDPTHGLAEAARAADLIIAGPPSQGFAGDGYRSVDLGQLILSAGRPVLIPADDAEQFKAEKILVAWKDTREARRAVADAMPLLVHARDVLVATLEDQESKQAAASAADVVRFLMKHGANARSEVFSHEGTDAGERLAGIGREMGADLILSGGYGHSRFREWAFGGVTRSLLHDGSITRLMSY